MDPDELVDALTAQQSAPADNGSNWDGRVAVNRRTGERLVYRMNPTGHGRFVALNAAAADPQSRQRLGDLQTRVTQGQRVLDIGRNFMDLNATAQTGGLQDDPNLPEFLRGQVAPNAQRFRAMSQQMIGANWQPGTSGMMNTATEMAMQANRYPSATNTGPVNRDTFLQMAEDVGVQQRAVEDMRNWLTQHPTLDGWDEHWGQIEPRLRPQIRAAAARQFNERTERAQSRVPTDTMSPAAMGREQQRQTEPIEMVRDQRTGRIVPRQ